MTKLVPKFKNSGKIQSSEDLLANALATVWEGAKEFLTPTEATTVAAKTALTLLDPTGITSWGDAVQSTQDFVLDPNIANFGWMVLDGLSALPVLGRATTPVKVFKEARKMAKAIKPVTKNAVKRKTKKILYDTRGQRLNGKIDTVLETFFPFMNRPTRAVLDFTTKYISNPLYETLSTNPIFRNTPFNPLNVRTYRNFDSLVGYFNFGKTLAGVPHDIVDYNKNKQ